MLKLKKEQGYSLIELILVLGLSSLAFVSTVQWEVKKAKTANAEIAGEQFAEVGRALSTYITREQVNLAYNIPSGTQADMSIEVLKGNASGFFIPHQYLPTTFNSVNSFGTNYKIQIRNTNGRLEGVVLSENPICEFGTAIACPSATNPIKYDWIGAAMRKMGPQSGMTRNGNFLSGLNAGWSLTTTEFAGINNPGLIGYRVSTTDTSLYDAQYLRLDGTSTMLGNLNMGNYSIENATNISLSGWLQGYGILANTIVSGSINNTGDIQTTNLYATNLVKVGPNSLPTNTVGLGNGDLIVDKNVYATDIYLGGDLNDPSRTKTEAGHDPNPLNNRKIPNAWLSDLLPKYVSRGIYKVDDGAQVDKPYCNGGGVPKIEVIPQTTYAHGRVYGQDYLQSQGSMTNWEAWVYWDQIAYSPNLAWANDLGGTPGKWQVRFDTTKYDSYMATDENGVSAPIGIPTFTMSGLAHVYCDYNF
jgi:type II secretory pathway pseudopilin PulG